VMEQELFLFHPVPVLKGGKPCLFNLV
jgi:hypothetical protein